MGVNFSEILIKGKKVQFELAGNSSYPSSSYRGSTVHESLTVLHYNVVLDFAILTFVRSNFRKNYLEYS